MPYIKTGGRLPLDILIEALAGKINSKGDLNYVICELVGQLIIKSFGSSIMLAFPFIIKLWRQDVTSAYPVA